LPKHWKTSGVREGNVWLLIKEPRVTHQRVTFIPIPKMRCNSAKCLKLSKRSITFQIIDKHPKTFKNIHLNGLNTPQPKSKRFISLFFLGKLADPG